MSDMNWKEYYEHQVEWYKKEVKWADNEIAFLTKELERSRNHDKEMVEWVASKEDADEWERETFKKGYQSVKTRDLKNKRLSQYRHRKNCRARLMKYQAHLAFA